MESVGAKYTVIELDERADGGAIQDALAAATGQRTVPNVFISGKSVGGGDDVERLAGSGKLLDMAKAAGAVSE